MKKPELLIPAGTFEKLKVGIHYGADAVYLAGTKYGLRKKAGNFSSSDLRKAIEYSHEKKVRVYLTVNIFPHSKDLKGIAAYLKEAEDLGVDAVIIADPGVLQIAKEIVPKLPIHLSTQANTINWASAQFWKSQGIQRICLARELSLQEILEIKEKTEAELELFIHGAMCISYSGRCFMSKYMNNRDANEGDCSQSCRWEYFLMEKKRVGQYFPIEEDENGTYFFSSKDLCLIKYIPDIIQSGITSLKIEGRMKSVYYVGMVTKIYREAIDKFFKDGKQYKFDPEWQRELSKISNRDFTTSFFNGKPANDIAHVLPGFQTHEFIGIVQKPLSKNRALVDIRNKVAVGDEVEWVGRKNKPIFLKIESMYDNEGIAKKEIAQPNDRVVIPLNSPANEYDILRRKIDGKHSN